MDITRVTEDLERVGYLYIGNILHMCSVVCTALVSSSQYHTTHRGDGRDSDSTESF